MQKLLLALCLTTAGMAAPAPEYRFQCERYCDFVQERITLDFSNHFVITGRTVGGDYRHEGDLSESEVAAFLQRLHAALAQRPSQTLAEGWRQSIRTQDLSWQGPWTAADGAWYDGSWLEREKLKARPPLKKYW